MRLLNDKTAIITGASSGIGRAAAKVFAREGAKLVINGRRQDALDAVVAEIVAEGGSAVAVAGDVRDEALQASLVEMAVSRFGRLDIAFNNAGVVGQMVPVAGLSLEGWRETIETNLTAAFLGAKHQSEAMGEGGGSLIFTSTFVGHTAGMPGMGAYAASKAGLIGFVQVLAAELAFRNIRVNALLPGGTDTPASITNAPDATAEVLAFVNGLHALKRLAQPEEIANAALFLASDLSSFVTGTAMLADGGVSISRT
ncbi:SDR family oxidoreductase [Rhizobium bangladeshense]|uniref:SDR family oxidoreductase n=1 Tax=Rhizobium bangladeshense TaxID=1138189 RepID=UPI001A986F19|nr:SDR family oxidoreductase [Rhizobium bangladeshense]MBX4898034.1 SDR family oxidoreductase [Rhizobium bangladeshense]MBX4902104.1 SDR family oxidoreductase [Rhizobium bangladeshense]MBX4930825.1 SDR family oxidoreductase [Rhizobium bangladeshense]MBY3580873.1 SDR family oxidoreductase [Rhizobium bangladeshense]MBY3615455.1 SDR family oxidoreductase [Rhizobium bangladeshense]